MGSKKEKENEREENVKCDVINTLLIDLQLQYCENWERVLDLVKL